MQPQDSTNEILSPSPNKACNKLGRFEVLWFAVVHDAITRIAEVHMWICGSTPNVLQMRLSSDGVELGTCESVPYVLPCVVLFPTINSKKAYHRTVLAATPKVVHAMKQLWPCRCSHLNITSFPRPGSTSEADPNSPQSPPTSLPPKWLSSEIASVPPLHIPSTHPP